MNFKNLLLSALRTFVPWAMGFVLPWATANLGWTPDDVSLLTNMLVSGAYYLLVRLAERYLTPKFGWLLGAPSSPVYAPIPVGAQDVSVSIGAEPLADRRYER